MTNIDNKINDWEMSEDFYSNDNETKELSLEDFMVDDEPADCCDTMTPPAGTAFAKAVADVKAVRELLVQCKTNSEIANLLGLTEDYVYEIAFTLNAAREDTTDDAIARLIM